MPGAPPAAGTGESARSATGARRTATGTGALGDDSGRRHRTPASPTPLPVSHARVRETAALTRAFLAPPPPPPQVQGKGQGSRQGQGKGPPQGQVTGQGPPREGPPPRQARRASPCRRQADGPGRPGHAPPASLALAAGRSPEMAASARKTARCRSRERDRERKSRDRSRDKDRDRRASPCGAHAGRSRAALPLSGCVQDVALLSPHIGSPSSQGPPQGCRRDGAGGAADAARARGLRGRRLRRHAAAAPTGHGGRHGVPTAGRVRRRKRPVRRAVGAPRGRGAGESAAAAFFVLTGCCFIEGCGGFHRTVPRLCAKKVP